MSGGNPGGDGAHRLRAEGFSPGSWSNGPGDHYSAHQHDYDKVIVVERGSITFGLVDRGEQAHLDAGDRLELPAGTSHDASVGANGVTCLEAHLAAGTFDDVNHRPAGEW